MLDFGFYNMDCMEGMKEFPDKYFDLAIVDPPYGIGENPKRALSRARSNPRWKNATPVVYVGGDWDNKRPDAQYFNELFRVSKNQIIWGGGKLFCRASIPVNGVDSMVQKRTNSKL